MSDKLIAAWDEADRQWVEADRQWDEALRALSKAGRALREAGYEYVDGEWTEEASDDDR